MTLSFERFVNPPFSQVTYLIRNRLRECILVDPGGHHDEILNLIDREALRFCGILLTHAHCDHVAGVMPIAERFDAPIYVHPKERGILEYSGVYWKFIAPGRPFHGPKWERVQTFPGDELQLGEFHLNIIPAPGHTPGSCLVRCDDIVLTGDTVFKNTIGRTDLVGGDPKRLTETIAQFPEFSEQTIFLPGHGPQFTAADLRRENRQFNDIRSPCDSPI